MARAQTVDENILTRDMEILAEQMAGLKADVVALTEMMTEMTQSRTANMEASVEEKLNSASDKVADKLAKAQTTGHNMCENIDHFIQRQPTAALGIAACLGFLVGMLGTRK